jgi:hypothetical protein
LNEEPDVDHPYASRDRYDELLPVPNGDADDAHERLSREDGNIASYRTGHTCGEQSKAMHQRRPRTRRAIKKKAVSLNTHSLDWTHREGMLTSWKTSWT